VFHCRTRPSPGSQASYQVVPTPRETSMRGERLPDDEDPLDDLRDAKVVLEVVELALSIVRQLLGYALR